MQGGGGEVAKASAHIGVHPLNQLRSQVTHIQRIIVTKKRRYGCVCACERVLCVEGGEEAEVQTHLLGLLGMPTGEESAS